MLLELRNVSIAYNTGQVVQNVSFQVKQGETVCIVGESGSGKTTVLQGILGLLRESGHIVQGEILFEGKNLSELSAEEYRKMRGQQIGMIYQQAGRSMDPVARIGKQFYEMFCTREKIDKKKANERAAYFLSKMHLKDPQRILKSYPTALSGGTNQRVAIAMALAMEPKLILADEPTSALDVTVQIEIVKALRQAKELSGAGILMVTHNMGVVAHLADQIGVMHNGQLVEWGTREKILTQPSHPYTRMLLESVLKVE
ncbi:MAG: ABC transporter ATP-binding protein [Ruminococcus sp.]|jgi:peptide/nickel transport system ATP-binding protein